MRKLEEHVFLFSLCNLDRKWGKKKWEFCEYGERMVELESLCVRRST